VGTQTKIEQGWEEGRNSGKARIVTQAARRMQTEPIAYTSWHWTSDTSWRQYASPRTELDNVIYKRGDLCGSIPTNGYQALVRHTYLFLTWPRSSSYDWIIDARKVVPPYLLCRSLFAVSGCIMTLDVLVLSQVLWCGERRSMKPVMQAGDLYFSYLSVVQSTGN